MYTGSLDEFSRFPLRLPTQETFVFLLKTVEKISLCLYVRNTVNEAKKFPHRFTLVPRTAPAYQSVIQKISKMDAESWMISNNDGGTPFVMGDMAWERYQAKDEDISFATFSGGRYYPQ